MEYVFEATGLTKRFEQTIALDRVDLKIRRQSIVGLLGRNGSGKTTTHRVGLIDVGIFFASIFVTLSVVGHLAGWLVGYPLRFDFIPFFLRPLLATILLIPLAQWGGLHLQVATRRRADNTLVAVIFGVLGFVALAWIWTELLPRLFATPIAELTASAILLLLSQSLYLRKLTHYFTSADLV